MGQLLLSQVTSLHGRGSSTLLGAPHCSVSPAFKSSLRTSDAAAELMLFALSNSHTTERNPDSCFPQGDMASATSGAFDSPTAGLGGPERQGQPQRGEGELIGMISSLSRASFSPSWVLACVQGLPLSSCILECPGQVARAQPRPPRPSLQP